MKNVIVTGVCMLGLGIAIGWVAKPDAEKSVSAAETKSSSTKPDVASVVPPARETEMKTKRAEREVEAKKNPGGITDAQMAQAKKMQGEMMKQMMGRHRTQFEGRIEKLTESLNLSDDQKRVMTDWLETKMKSLEALDYEDAASMSKMTELMEDLNNKGLEAQLAPLLSEEQKGALGEFKEVEIRGKVDAAALKNLGKLQSVVAFEEGQRDAVYKVLTDAADEAVRNREEKQDASQFFMEGMGMDMDPYDLGLQDLMTDVAGDSMNPAAPDTDRKAMGERLREKLDERIEAKVEALRPVLNEKQLEQYRAELKSKGAGVYGPMIMGFGGE